MKNTFFAFTVALFSGYGNLFAQNFNGDEKLITEDSIFNMSLDSLVNLNQSNLPTELELLVNSKISVSSKKPLSSRNSPSVVTVISDDEIERMGARELMDVLRMVPGFDFGIDVQGVVGIGVRGNWAHEGKILLMVDGQEMNELTFSTLQLGNNYLPDNIKRIEIIRGPGSAVYGGFAEYAVVHIITYNGEDLKGAKATATYGVGAKGYLRRNVSLSLGNSKKDFQYHIHGTLGQGLRSDASLRDLKGNSIGMQKVYTLNPTVINLGLSYKELSTKIIVDDYRMNMQEDGSGNILSRSYPNNFRSYLGELKYDIVISHKLTLTPKFNYKGHNAYQQTQALAPPDSSFFRYDLYSERYKGNLTANWEAHENLNFLIGAETYHDRGINHIDNFMNGTHKLTYTTVAMFMQGLLRKSWANVTFGARYDHNNVFGSAFVPRVGITKRINKFHSKLLASQSFRFPGIANVDKGDGIIKPEKSTIFELETGYQLTRSSLVSANLFDYTTMHPIIYTVDTTIVTGNSDAYSNFPKVGSRGIELEYLLKSSRILLRTNYAYYSTAGKNEVPYYAIAGKDNSVLGLANHKFNLLLQFKPFKNRGLWVCPSLNLIGKRYGYGAIDQNQNPQIIAFAPVWLGNLFINYHTNISGLTLGIGCYNIMNQTYNFIQPYAGGHGPMPGNSREYMLRLSYQIGRGIWE